MTVERAADFGGLTLLDDRGRPARVGDAWKERPVVFAFLRHWG
jgi:hypothetical protein